MRMVPLLLAAVLVLGCADLKEIMSLDVALMSEFHEQGIHVDLSSHALTVTFANSTRATEPDSAKAAFARPSHRHERRGILPVHATGPWRAPARDQDSQEGGAGLGD